MHDTLTLPRSLCAAHPSAPLCACCILQDFFLYYVLSTLRGQALLFVNSIGSVKRLHSLLTILGVPAFALHAQMQQRSRLKSLDRFRAAASQRVSVIVCTDVAARGLDIPTVAFVVHYHMPLNPELYIHRAGRTARAGRTGISVALIGEKDQHKYRKTVSTLAANRDNAIAGAGGMTQMPVDTATLTAVKRRVKLARQIDELQQTVAAARGDSKWMRAAVADAGLDFDDDDLAPKKLSKYRADEDAEAGGAQGARAAALKQANAQLKALQAQIRETLKQPLVASSLKHSFFTLNPALSSGGDDERADLESVAAQVAASDASADSEHRRDRVMAKRAKAERRKQLLQMLKASRAAPAASASAAPSARF
jgi:ATP-dependent RNA helicase DDX24/MAK5